MEWIKFIVVTILTLSGLFSLVASMYGTYKYEYVLNRMQTAAIGDTLGISLCLIALIVYCGFSFTTFKLFLVIIFLWLASPVAGHLTSRLEVKTNPKIEEECEVRKQ